MAGTTGPGMIARAVAACPEWVPKARPAGKPVLVEYPWWPAAMRPAVGWDIGFSAAVREAGIIGHAAVDVDGGGRHVAGDV